jgi:hypothetical protein
MPKNGQRGRFEMVTNFSLDNFIIENTRSLRKDTDYCTVSVTVGNNPAVTKTQAMGDVDNGTHAVGLAVAANIPTDVPTPVVFSYVILNNGNSDHAAVQKGIESALSTIGQQGAKAVASQIAQPIGEAVGAALGASLGTAVVPLVGTAIGALAGYVVGKVGGILFANCDGVVAAGVTAFVSTDLMNRTVNGKTIRTGVQHPGTDSATGCGANSKYATNTTISTIAVIVPNFDLNGKYSAGGAPGPIIHVSGDAITVDMSAYHRPTAAGTLVDGNTAHITFPDDKTYTVAIVAPNTLRFSNNTTWTKIAAFQGTLLTPIGTVSPIATTLAGASVS